MSRPTKRCLPRLENLEQRIALSAAPTGAEQYMLELINEARTNPSAAAERIEATIDDVTLDTLDHFNVDLGAALNEISSATPRPPVGWDNNLARAADSHSRDLIRRNTQSHYGPNGENLADRLDDANYGGYDAAAENVMARARSTDEAVQAFLIDWNNPQPGHRETILQPKASEESYTEVGLSVVEMPNKTWNPFLAPSDNSDGERLMVTQVFSRETNAKPKVLGVIYNDESGDRFYTDGEGVASATITVVSLESGQEFKATSWTSGGYQVEVPSGRYRVQVESNGQKYKPVEVRVGTENVKVDFDLDRTPEAPTTSAPEPTRPATPTPPPITVEAPVSTPVSKPVSTPVSRPVSNIAPIKFVEAPRPTTSEPAPVVIAKPAPTETPSTPVVPTTPSPAPQVVVSRPEEPTKNTDFKSNSDSSEETPSRPTELPRNLSLVIRYRAAVTRRFLAASDSGVNPTVANRLSSLRMWRA